METKTNRAVSSVLGSILMAGMVILLVSLLAAPIFLTYFDIDESPNSEFNLQFENGEVTIQYLNGEPINSDRITLLLNGEEFDYDFGTELLAGEQYSFELPDGDTEVQVMWSNERESSAIVFAQKFISMAEYIEGGGELTEFTATVSDVEQSTSTSQVFIINLPSSVEEGDSLEIDLGEAQHHQHDLNYPDNIDMITSTGEGDLTIDAGTNDYSIMYQITENDVNSQLHITISEIDASNPDLGDDYDVELRLNGDFYEVSFEIIPEE